MPAAGVKPLDQATAFAPASVANVAVGFDVLGHSVQAIGDRVTAIRSSVPGIRIIAIKGVVEDLPLETERNTAGMAVLAMAKALNLSFGIDLIIEKGIPLSSGLGGSAASAVGGVVAANALLDKPLGNLDLLKFAMHGEAVASGAVHVDNIAPSLYGGLVLTVGIDNPVVTQIPVPEAVRCVLVHPHMMLSTREARQILCKTVEIEPQRQVLIPGFKAVKDAALSGGALGCSISGAGPTVFAWCEEQHAVAIRDGMVGAFAAHGLGSDAWISPLDPRGARIVAA